jgi:hypothetical protein
MKGEERGERRRKREIGEISRRKGREEEKDEGRGERNRKREKEERGRDIYCSIQPR